MKFRALRCATNARSGPSNLAERYATHPGPEVLALPLLHRGFRFEIAEIFEIQPLILAVQLDCPLLSSLNDRVNIVVDEQPARTCEPSRSTALAENSLFRCIEDLLGAVSDHLQQLVLVRS